MRARLEAAGHGAMDLVRGRTPNHQHLRERLVFLWIGTIVLDLIFSGLAAILEIGPAGSGLHTYGDALFWTTTQLLTVSSQLPNPVTPGGKILDVVMELVGMTLITAQAGSLGSFLYRRSMERDPSAQHAPDPADDPPDPSRPEAAT